jgi:hypothetical protein
MMEAGGEKIIPRVLLIVSGSVATIKIEEISKGLLEFAEVKIVTTKAAQHFFEIEKVRGLGKPQKLISEFIVREWNFCLH